MTDGDLRTGVSVFVDLTGTRLVTCLECGYGWGIAGHNDVTCPECGANGIIGRLLTAEDFEDSGISRS